MTQLHDTHNSVSDEHEDTEGLPCEVGGASISAAQFAKTLRAWRLKRGWTQDDLVKFSGVSKSSISLAERAYQKYPPKLVTISRLANAMGISLEDIMQMPTSSERAALHSFIAQDGNRAAIRVPANQYDENELDHVTVPVKWALGVSNNPAELTCFSVDDQSMLPTIRSGDVAMLEPVRNVAPGIYLVTSDAADSARPTGIRRVTPIPGGALRITCDNERFSGNNAVFSPGEITILAKVVFVARCHIAE